ncbi:Fasciclin-1 [Eufriesea mexicana]|uniref:Fasciclin-1 n=1 Tax=Eufriesea mexicana TaxID=516756 RepID=A0A310SLY1_9HYME|nr:Fasciclin-1 [Eufriesea mexicana]
MPNPCPRGRNRVALRLVKKCTPPRGAEPQLLADKGWGKPRGLKNTDTTYECQSLGQVTKLAALWFPRSGLVEGRKEGIHFVQGLLVDSSVRLPTRPSLRRGYLASIEICIYGNQRFTEDLRETSNLHLPSSNEDVLHIINEVLEPVRSNSAEMPIYSPNAFEFLNQSENLDLGVHRVRIFRQRIVTEKKEEVFKADGRYTFLIPVEEGFQVLHIINEVLEPVRSNSAEMPIYSPNAFEFLNQSENLDLGVHRVRIFRQRIVTEKKEEVFKADGRYTFLIPVEEGFQMAAGLCSRWLSIVMRLSRARNMDKGSTPHVWNRGAQFVKDPRQSVKSRPAEPTFRINVADGTPGNDRVDEWRRNVEKLGAEAFDAEGNGSLGGLEMTGVERLTGVFELRTKVTSRKKIEWMLLGSPWLRGKRHDWEGKPEWGKKDKMNGLNKGARVQESQSVPLCQSGSITCPPPDIPLTESKETTKNDRPASVECNTVEFAVSILGRPKLAASRQSLIPWLEARPWCTLYKGRVASWVLFRAVDKLPRLARGFVLSMELLWVVVVVNNGASGSFISLVPSPRPEKVDRVVIDGHVIPNHVLFTTPTPHNVPYETLTFTDNVKVTVSFLKEHDKVYVQSNTLVGDAGHPTGVVLAEIIKANIPVRNGVVHLIQRPLMVVDTTVKDFLEEKKDGPVYKFYETIRDFGEEIMSTISHLRDVTLFAPSNAALEEPGVQKILQDKQRVKEILNLHYVKERLPLDKIKNKTVSKVPTAADRKKLYFNVVQEPSGKQIVTVEGGGVNATVVTANIAATNGLIHIIDRVLGVPYTTVLEKLKTDPMLNSTYFLGQRHGFNGQLNDTTKHFTYFAPRDYAWNVAAVSSPSTSKKIFMPEFSYHTKQILERHLVIADEAYTMAKLKEMKHNDTIILPAARDSLKLRVREYSESYQIEWEGNWIQVFRPDVECTNGIIHVIDAVLLKDGDVRVTGTATMSSLAPHLITILVAKWLL